MATAHDSPSRINPRLLLGCCLLVLAIQIGIPVYQYFRSPYLQKCGWQMYSRPHPTPSIMILYPDGKREKVDPEKYFGGIRNDTIYAPTLVGHLKESLPTGSRIVLE